MKTVAIIPARGGSKGIPGKNLVDINGTSLIGHTVKQAVQAKGVDHVVVTSDSEEILDESSKHGAHSILRPSELATDTATTESALEHCLYAFEKKNSTRYDTVVFLSPTQPYRKIQWIEHCVEILACDQHVHSAFTVYLTHKNYWREEQHRGMELPTGGDYLNKYRKLWWTTYTNRQQREPLFEENTGVACATRAAIIRDGERIGANCRIIEIDRFNLDIHTEDDLKIARALL